MTLSRRFTTAVAALIAAAGTLAAQGAAQAAAGDSTSAAVVVQASSPAPAASAAAEPVVSLAPFAANASVGVHASSPVQPVPYAPPRREKTSHATALMIVGGAGLIVGALIGGTAGTIVMVGGGVTGLIGLYQYLQ